MTRENLAFLFGGLAFGVLFGYGLFHAVEGEPDLSANASTRVAADRPQGPLVRNDGAAAPSGAGAGGGGGAPVMQTINRLKSSLESNPDDRAALTQLGHLYSRVGMWEDAIGFYERVVAIDPDDAEILALLGNCYSESGDVPRALELYDRAHQADPNAWEPLFNTAVAAAFRLGDRDRAIAALAALQKISPRPPELTESLRRLNEALKQQFEEKQGEAETAPTP